MFIYKGYDKGRKGVVNVGKDCQLFIHGGYNEGRERECLNRLEPCTVNLITLYVFLYPTSKEMVMNK